ncbi:MAG: toll/interleukin-1 receptor domain-containing protein [Rhizobiales bacterium]|nr:toll/interleukin-1 receptor domain-containing protein [Hyphomicrobiales bacterium]
MRAFISYSHRDTDALERLHAHLASLRREGSVSTWYDRDILAGSELTPEIQRELESADLFLLLISPDFIASDYCITIEMSHALERHDQGTARVVPIIIEPCDWKSIDSLRRIKAVPKDGKPVSEWANENTAYLDIVQEIRRIVENFQPATTVESAPPSNSPSAQSDRRSRYRVQKDFDEIDRREFREKCFSEIKSYFEEAINEISQIEGIKARFTSDGPSKFYCTIINKLTRRGTAHITVHCGASGAFMGDIYFSFAENAPINTSNGGFQVSHDEYDLFLQDSMSAMTRSGQRLSSEQAAKHLWNQFIEQAGITNA